MTTGPPLPTHRAPTRCPVWSTSLITLRLGCPSCATELSGHFDTCRYCRLDGADLAILEVFLRSRGNIRDVQAHLGVSYPTARARLTEVLETLGLGDPPAAQPPPATPTATAAAVAEERTVAAASEVGEMLRALASGRIGVDEAEGFLESQSPH